MNNIDAQGDRGRIPRPFADLLRLAFSMSGFIYGLLAQDSVHFHSRLGMARNIAGKLNKVLPHEMPTKLCCFASLQGDRGAVRVHHIWH